MATTPNYLWPTPDDTDYVKDGAAAIRSLANAIDAELVARALADLADVDATGALEGDVLTRQADGSYALEPPAGPVSVEANTQTASYTLALTDAGKVVEMNVAAANTLTVPPNTSVAFDTGTIIEVHQYGAGQTTVAAGAGVTIRSPGGLLAVSEQYGSVVLRKRATDEWTLEGNLA